MLDEATLFRAYIVEGMTERELADQQGLTEAEIARDLAEYGIPRRPRMDRPRSVSLDDLQPLGDDRSAISRLAVQIGVSPSWLFAVSRHRQARPDVPSPEGHRDRDPAAPSADDLFRFYIEEGLSLVGVAERLGMTSTDVRARLDHHGIPVRPRGTGGPVDIERLRDVGAKGYAKRSSGPRVDFLQAVLAYTARRDELPQGSTGTAAPQSRSRGSSPRETPPPPVVPPPPTTARPKATAKGLTSRAKRWLATKTGTEQGTPPSPRPPISQPAARPRAEGPSRKSGQTSDEALSPEPPIPAPPPSAAPTSAADTTPGLQGQVAAELVRRLDISDETARAISQAIVPHGMYGPPTLAPLLVAAFLREAGHAPGDAYRLAHKRLMHLADATTQVVGPGLPQYESAMEHVASLRSHAGSDPLAALDDLNHPWESGELPKDAVNTGSRRFQSQLASASSTTEPHRATRGGTPVPPPTKPQQREDDAVKVPSVAGEPPLTTPLFRIESSWAYRWRIGGRGSLTVPVEWLQLNAIEPDDEVTLQLNGEPITASRSKYGTTYHLEPAAQIRVTSKGRSNDLVFLSVDHSGTISMRRITAQKLGRAETPLRRAFLLAGQVEDHVTLSALLWALGAEDVGAGLEEAKLICRHRSDGLISRELDAFEQDASVAPEADLESIFGRLDD